MVNELGIHVKNVKQLLVTKQTTLRDAMSILNSSGQGMLLLEDGQGQFLQTVTDGDLRRLLLSGVDLDDCIEALPEIKSIVLREPFTNAQALELMNQQKVSQIPVLTADGKVLDVIERKDVGEQILLSTPHMGESERAYVEEAFATNWIAPVGPNVDAFEKELAQLVGVGHAAALSSGTAAIHLALLVLGVTRDDAIFCSTFTFAASANPIVYQGAKPVFIDSEYDSWNMCPKALKRAFVKAQAKGQLPKAVIVVNLYGQSANMIALKEICDSYDVPIIEDAAESLGANYQDKPSGTFGKIGIYSFNGNKIITTSGGGMLVSDDEELVKKARFLSTQAREPVLHYEHSEIGYNYRMSNILAGVGRGQLQVLKARVEARRSVFEQYQSALSDIEAIQWMPEPNWSYSNRWLTACTVDPNLSPLTSTELIAALGKESIEARPLWKPMHQQPVYKGSEYVTAEDGHSVSDSLFETGLCLPSGSNMAQAQIDRVIAVIRKLLASKAAVNA